MHHPILIENQNRRKELPMGLLLCFVMFCVWQMGIIYFVGPSLNIDGRTPLPISADNLTVLIVSGYVLSILAMIFLPGRVILLSRLSAGAALLSALGLFLPLGTEVLTLLICVQCFCCCFMIGFESATMVHHLTSNSVTRHLLIAYPIGYTLVAVIQNDFFTVDFSVFRLLMVVMLVMLLYFYCRMPLKGGIAFVKRGDGVLLPKQFLCGFMLLAFLGALLGVIAPAAAAEVKHGVFTAYLGCALGSGLLYMVSKKTGRHPISFVSYVIGFSAIGYVLLVVSEYVPGLALAACAVMGMGMAVCALLPLFALLLVKQYPSKLIVPGYIALAMLAVIVQSALVEVFRFAPTLLNLAYLVVVIILAIIFVLVEPFLLYSMRRDFTEAPVKEEPLQQSERPVQTAEQGLTAAPEGSPLLSCLTKREREVVDLLGYGHSNGDIAKILFISEHTVKDHTKNIYRKLGVHSRFELAALVARSEK